MNTIQMKLTRENHLRKPSAKEVTWKTVIDYISLNKDKFDNFPVFDKRDIHGEQYVLNLETPSEDNMLGQVSSIVIDGLEITFTIDVLDNAAGLNLLRIYHELKEHPCIGDILCFAYAIDPVDDQCRKIVGPYINYDYIKEYLVV